MAEKAVDLATQTDDVIDFLTQVIEEGDYVLSQTPEMLPVLKQAGVVDSGGQGLMQVMKGGLDGLLGKGIPFDPVLRPPETTGSAKPKVAAGSDDLSTSDIKYGYCTEFIVNVEKPYDMEEEQKFKGYLESIGDCVVVVSDDDIIKVHVHTNHPGLAFEKGSDLRFPFQNEDRQYARGAPRASDPERVERCPDTGCPGGGKRRRLRLQMSRESHTDLSLSPSATVSARSLRGSVPTI